MRERQRQAGDRQVKTGTHTIRSQPKDFQDSGSLVNETLRNIHNRLEAGETLDKSMGGADAALQGA
jgi:hypothetical protein